MLSSCVWPNKGHLRRASSLDKVGMDCGWNRACPGTPDSPGLGSNLGTAELFFIMVGPTDSC